MPDKEMKVTKTKTIPKLWLHLQMSDPPTVIEVWAPDAMDLMDTSMARQLVATGLRQTKIALEASDGLVALLRHVRREARKPNRFVVYEVESNMPHSAHPTREAAEEARRHLAAHCSAEDISFGRALSWFAVKEVQ